MSKYLSVLIALALAASTLGCGKPAAEVSIDDSKITAEQRQQVEQQRQQMKSMVVPPPQQGAAQGQQTQ